MELEYFTIQDVMDMYKVSRTTVDRWRKMGLPWSTVGRGVRFEKDVLIKWVKESLNR